MDETKPPTTTTAKPRHRRRRWLRWGILFVVLGGALWVSRGWFGDLALWRAKHAIEERRHERALSWLDIAAKLDRDNAEFHFLSAQAHRRLEHFQRVREHWKQAHELGWSTRDLERERWIAQAQTGQFAQMSEHFPKLFIKAGSDGPEISNAFVIMLLSEFRLQPALEVLDAWQRDFPEDPKPHVLRGRILTVVHNWKQAESEFKEAIRLSPKDLDTRLELALCLMKQLRYQQAETQLRQCLEGATLNTPAVVALAVCLRKRLRLDEARQLLDEHWPAVKENVEALREMGRIELAAEQPKAALPFLKKAIQARPVDRETRYAYALALRAAGRLKEAQQEFVFVNEATKPVMRLGSLMPKLIDQPDDVPLRFEIAEITWKYKSRAEGAKWLHSVLEFDPNHAPTHRALAVHYDSIGDKSRSEFYRQRSGNGASR